MSIRKYRKNMSCKEKVKKFSRMKYSGNVLHKQTSTKSVAQAECTSHECKKVSWKSRA